MAEKPIKAKVKLQITAGQATPAPPVGPALGQHQVNIVDFCKQFNAATSGMAGMVVPAIISIYKDRTFSFILKTPPAADSSQEGGRAGHRLRHAQQGQGRNGHGAAGARDCRAQDEGLERQRCRGCHPHDRGYGPEHGHRGRLGGVL